jgi:hypothetical protein
MRPDRLRSRGCPRRLSGRAAQSDANFNRIGPIHALGSSQPTGLHDTLARRHILRHARQGGRHKTDKRLDREQIANGTWTQPRIDGRCVRIDRDDCLGMAVVTQAQDGRSVAPSVTLNLSGMRTDRSSTVANDLSRRAGATGLVDEFGHPTLTIRGDPVKLEAALRDLLARNRIEPVEVENLAEVYGAESTRPIFRHLSLSRRFPKPVVRSGD